MKRQSEVNRLHGAAFEALFVHRARLTGHLPVKQHLSFRYAAGGKRIITKAELDFALVNKRGQVAYLDCKVVATPYFLKSRLDKAQVMRACVYNQWRVASGFVVHFTQHKLVSFYSGAQIGLAAPKARFLPSSGLILGDSMHFDLALLYRTPEA